LARIFPFGKKLGQELSCGLEYPDRENQPESVMHMPPQPPVFTGSYVEIDSPADLGRLLRQARKEAGMTLQQAALACNVSVRNLLEIERGKETARVGRVIHLLAQFGLRLLIARRELK
jgi:DNA-binding XRE family transcriptional regulator